eukprot:278117_1
MLRTKIPRQHQTLQTQFVKQNIYVLHYVVYTEEMNKVHELLWPIEVADEIKPQLRFSKNIYDFTTKELQLQLLKRCLPIRDDRHKYFNYTQMLRRLKTYLNRSEVQQFQIKDNNLLVAGYIKQTQNN